MHELEQNDKHDVFQYHKNSRQREENENRLDQEKLKNIDELNYASIKNNDMHIQQLSIHHQRKVSINFRKKLFYILH